MTVQENNQTNLTDELYEKDITLSELHGKLGAVERRIHYVRSKVGAMQLRCDRNSSKLYKALGGEISYLTSTMSWLSDAMFFVGNESEDVETRSIESYKVLTERDNPIEIEGRIDLELIEADVLQIRKDLMRLLDEYWDAINDTVPCMSIYEYLIDNARLSVNKFKEINYYNVV